MFGRRTSKLPAADEALSGRPLPGFSVPSTHAVLGTPLQGTAEQNSWPQGTQVIYVGMGCFWGAERVFWQLEGVVSTAVGYQGGVTPNPTYEETCSGLTGHTEAVMVAYDPQRISTTDVLRTFWASHDPTQGFRQGNDRGTQYRSAVFWTTPEQHEAVEATRAVFAEELRRNGFGDITTDLRPVSGAGPFYYAEEYHQQYLHKVPNGYCGLGGTGVSCPLPALPA